MEPLAPRGLGSAPSGLDPGLRVRRCAPGYRARRHFPPSVARPPVGRAKTCSGREPDMERKKVSSDKIRSIGYDARNQVLEIEFSDGKIVQYAGVPSEVHRRLMAAPTIVSYFRDNIEDEYSAKRLR